jgi:uroporphyrinogen decarboxylase
MTDRENFLSIAKRTGYEWMPVSFQMCPDLARRYDAYIKEHPIDIPWDADYIPGLSATYTEPKLFLEKFYSHKNFKAGTQIDGWGVAHEPGSEAAYHMTYMHNPMENFDSVEQIETYPFPVFDRSALPQMKDRAAELHAAGRPVMGSMQTTIWETAWYMRGMENLMCDMYTEDEMATVLLDKVTDMAVMRAQAYAEAGADAIFLGDDVGMQHSIMMSVGLYEEWLMPRLKKVIDKARAINPNVVIFYHSCGRVTELIPSLIKAGIDVLDPVQPETMDFRELHEMYGDKLSFHGTLGTQSVMPFGTPEDVRRTVFENLNIAGEKGGLFVCPTHLLEPEVPVENVIAYIKACADYMK